MISSHNFNEEYVSKALSFSERFEFMSSSVNRQTRSRDFVRHVKLFCFVAVALREEILLYMFKPE